MGYFGLQLIPKKRIRNIISESFWNILITGPIQREMQIFH